MKVRAKYSNLSNLQLLDAAYKLGAGYEKYSLGCSQTTVAALQEILGFEEALVRAANSCCGGQATQVTGTCGGLIGGTMVLDYYFGRPIEKLSLSEVVPANLEALENGIGIAKIFCNKYIHEYGSILCPQIQTRLFGRTFHFEDPEEAEQFEKAGGHSDPTKCIGVVGNAARWVMEILLEKGAV